MNKQLYIILLLLMQILLGCREQYFPKIEKYEDILVVDGLITDHEGPHMVRLSRSFSFDESFPDPEVGALVIIFDEDQNEYYFSEEQAGVYQSSLNLKGEIGRSYMLHVSTADGETYESDWVELRSVPEIDSVTFEFEERPTTDINDPFYGVQIKINTHDPLDQTRYYRWEWTESWEFLTPISSSLYPGEHRCWGSSRSSIIAIGTSEHLSKDVLDDFPVYFISAGNSKLRIKYSTLVSQYSLSREAYSYWKSLQDITQNMGSLFDPTPAMVNGNLHNQNNSDIPVLGIFQASAVTSQRIFIDRSDIPAFLNIPSGFAACNFYTTADSTEIAYYDNHDYPFVDEYIDGETLFHIYTNSPVCFRCTMSGTNERPEYWPVE